MTSYLLARQVINPAGLNVRGLPSINGNKISFLLRGAPVNIFDGLTAVADGYTWQALILPNQQMAWAATNINGLPTLGIPQVPASRFAMGLHVVRGGASNSVVDLARRMKAAGTPLGAVVVVNEKSIANALVGLVPYVIYRDVPGSGNPDNPTEAEFASGRGDLWLVRLLPKYSGLDLSIYIQPCNEAIWHPNDGIFWLKAMQLADQQGGKLAIFADAVGNPTDDKETPGYTRIQKWQARVSALRYAKANGHIAVLHVYSSPNARPGELSPIEDQPYWEFRYRGYYAAVPEDARPTLVIGEAARETSRGMYDGLQPTLDWGAKLAGEVSRDKYVAAACLWTAGNEGEWANCSIDECLPRFPELLRRNL